jgi:hypothetical protein
MNILEYYYNDDTRRLYVEFSTKEDGDSYYRELELGFDDVEYYSLEIIEGEDLENIDKEFIIELINQYVKENNLPEEKSL